MAEKVLEVIEKLRKIREPETNVGILDLGLISGIEVNDEMIVVYVNFSYIRSSCKACIPINWMMVRSMVRKIERVLKEEGYRYMIVEDGSNEIYTQG